MRPYPAPASTTVAGQLAERGGGERDVEEAGAGDVDLGDAVGCSRSRAASGLGDLARRAAGGLGQPQRDVGGVVAVLGVLRAARRALGGHRHRRIRPRDGGSDRAEDRGDEFGRGHRSIVVAGRRAVSGPRGRTARPLRLRCSTSAAAKATMPDRKPPTPSGKSAAAKAAAKRRPRRVQDGAPRGRQDHRAPGRSARWQGRRHLEACCELKVRGAVGHCARRQQVGRPQTAAKAASRSSTSARHRGA